MPRLFLALLVLLAACTAAPTRHTQVTGVPEGHAPDASGPVPEASGPPTLFFLRRSKLTSFDIAARRAAVVGELPSADAALSPDTERLAVVRETSPLGPGPEGFRKPQLMVGETNDAGGRVLGPGRSPLWSPDGDGLAAIAPAGNGGCEGVESEGDQCRAERVVAYDPLNPETPARVIANGAPGYALLGWAGEDVLALRAPGVAVLGARELPVPPSELWGSSPAGGMLLRARYPNAEFVALDGSRVLASVHLGAGRLADGAWSFDGRTVAAVVIRPSGARLNSYLALIDSPSAAITRVPGSAGAQGQVVWSADSTRFAYLRIAPDDPGKLQAVTCETDLDCRPLFSFRQGVTLLGLR